MAVWVFIVLGLVIIAAAALALRKGKREYRVDEHRARALVIRIGAAAVGLWAAGFLAVHLLQLHLTGRL